MTAAIVWSCGVDHACGFKHSGDVVIFCLRFELSLRFSAFWCEEVLHSHRLLFLGCRKVQYCRRLLVFGGRESAVLSLTSGPWVLTSAKLSLSFGPWVPKKQCRRLLLDSGSSDHAYVGHTAGSRKSLETKVFCFRWRSANNNEDDLVDFRSGLKLQSFCLFCFLKFKVTVEALFCLC